MAFYEGVEGQQEILIALDDIIRDQGYQNRAIWKKLDELLEKVDPKEAEKRKKDICEDSSRPRVPSRCLI